MVRILLDLRLSTKRARNRHRLPDVLADENRLDVVLGHRKSEPRPYLVNLIDGDRLCELVEQQGIGIRVVTTVTEAWFDRFD